MLALLKLIRSFAIHRRHDVVLFKLQIVCDRPENARIIFHDENLCHVCSCNGMRTENVLPHPGVLMRSIRPLCASITWSARARPSPVPAMPSVSADCTR